MTDVQGHDVQAQHAAAVLGNRLQLAGRWGRPCLGYLLVFRPDPAAAAAFAAVQDRLLETEPSLLRQPEAAMHSTVAFLVPVFMELDRPKDEIWQRHSAGWLEVIASATAAAAGPARLTFRRLMLTDAAIIAVADEPSPVSELRRALAAALNLPWPISKGELVHVTLFRHAGPLADPAALLARLQVMELAIETPVSELLVIRETTFPCLEYEVLRTFAIGRP